LAKPRRKIEKGQYVKSGFSKLSIETKIKYYSENYVNTGSN